MILEVLLRQDYMSQEVINRWHYVSSGTPASVSLSFALMSAFGGVTVPITGVFPDDTIMQTLSLIQAIPLRYVELQVRALYDVSDFYLTPYPAGQVGGATGTAMSPFAAYALQSNRVRTDIRRGNKRLAGVTENYVGIGGVIEQTMRDTLLILAGQMSEPLVYVDEGNTVTFTPAVLSLEPVDEVGKPRKYRLYATEAEQLSNTAQGVLWTYKPFMTTQNSRKV